LIPQIDLEDYTLELHAARTEKAEEEAKVLTFDELKQLDSVELTAYIECAGNKRRYL